MMKKTNNGNLSSYKALSNYNKNNNKTINFKYNKIMTKAKINN